MTDEGLCTACSTEPCAEHIAPPTIEALGVIWRERFEQVLTALWDMQTGIDCWCDARDGDAPIHSPACAAARIASKASHDWHPDIEARTAISGADSAEWWRAVAVKLGVQRYAAIRLAKEATNGWACYAKREIEHNEISRLHRAIADLEKLESATSVDAVDPVDGVVTE